MRRFRRSLIAALPAALVLAAPATAAAAHGTGGAYATEGAITLTTTPKGLVGRRKLFTGEVSRRDRGRTVAVQRYDQISRQWTTIARSTAGDRGAFRARWKADRAGSLRVRALIEGSAQAASAAPEISITLYRGQQATWYGPTLYGNRTACGRRLTTDLIGVAHKTLPCGTKIEFLYRGRTVVAPVIDRGPYTDGVTWDLTRATADRIGFTSTGRGTVGALRANR